MRDLPPRLNFERTVAGQRLKLPRRRLGKGIFVVLGITVFGALFAGFPTAGFILPAIRTLLEGDSEGASAGFSLFGFAMALPFLIIGSAIAVGPWMFLLSRTTLFLEHDRLRVFRGIGPIGFSKQRSTDGLTGFEIEVGSSRTNGGPAKPIESMVNLKAVYEGKQDPFYVAFGYPQAAMRELADVLRDTLQPRGWSTREPELSVTETLSGADRPVAARGYDPDEPIPDQPDASNIVAEPTASGIAYRVPARGIRKGSRGMWFFALFWNGITWTMVIAFALGNVEMDSGDVPPWYVAVPFLGVFVLSGVAVAYYAIRMGTRSVLFDITGSADRARLLLEERHAFGQTHVELTQRDLTAIRVAPSGVSENDTPINQLTLHVTEDAATYLPKRWSKKGQVGLLMERDDDELRWLAARLRRDLQVGSMPPVDNE
ncbi:MAG: hypothetical protein AAGH92_04780 [Planctomycetota bacterium]